MATDISIIGVASFNPPPLISTTVPSTIPEEFAPKIITSLPEKGVSRSRAKIVIEKKRKGLRKGPGSKTGSPRAKITKKEAWMTRIRSQRKRLRELKTNRIIMESTYRKIYMVAGSGKFDSIADLERYLKTNDLWRNR